MTSTAAPSGYHTITPAIVVRNGPEAIEFYRRAFGAEEVSRMEGPGGTILHAEIRIGDSVVMLGEENEAWGTKSPLSTDGNPGSLHMYVADADAAFQRALDAGATVAHPLEDAFWGDRYGKVRDPFGHEWGIATRVKELTDAETQQAAQEWLAQMGSAQG
jgi:PhnB protein